MKTIALSRQVLGDLVQMYGITTQEIATWGRANQTVYSTTYPISQ